MTANDKKTLTSVNATVTSLSPRVDEINDTVDTITFVNVNYICGEPNSYSNLSEAL
jgi:hypothetical protein